ncbi:hypothetical protein [Adhaeribacter pallidiroseus]|nr:hypothetical protein [Adhaeribacter pallidiroseus]
MNKSALLHMVRNVSALSEQNVEELEKLVQNFPYCQTAHLLIAKAAYDKGNMLSNQKLRKAAAYATNRQLLKKLIYTTDAAVPLTVVEEFKNQFQAQAVAGKYANDGSEAALLSPVNQDEEAISSSINAENSNLDSETTAEDLKPIVGKSVEFIASSNSPQTIEPELEPNEDETNEPDSTAITPFTETEKDNTEPVELAEIDEPEYNLIEPQTANPEEEIRFLPNLEPAYTLTLSELEEMLQVEKWTSSVDASEPVISESQEEDIPVIEVEIPKSTAPTEIIRYELEVPEEMEETAFDQTLANFDSYLFKPEKDEFFNSELIPATTEEFIREVYLSNQLGYWMGSSRLGELLQVKDELTQHTPLQFYPDLILEYSKQNYLTPTDPPKTTPANRQFEIIDQFLKANPKLKAFSNEKMRAEPLDDLAFKSTKNTKNLASENLANIMVQQGKIKKAIKIYEHLIVKIPEKRAYFAAQIEKLRNQI